MLTFAEAARRPEAEVGTEVARLAEQGLEGIFIPASFEERYYLNVNLPEQLGRLFAPINAARIDEDVLEGLCEQAQGMVRTNVLVDDAVQIFYRALKNAGLDKGEIHARRPQTAYAEAAVRVMPPGTAVLHAVKRLWAHDWAFENVLARLDDTGGVGLEARPTLLLAGPPGEPNAEWASRLGVQTALVSPLGLVGAF